jgi:hypothetical protein
VAGRRDQGDFIAEPGVAGDKIGAAASAIGFTGR